MTFLVETWTPLPRSHSLRGSLFVLWHLPTYLSHTSCRLMFFMRASSRALCIFLLISSRVSSLWFLVQGISFIGDMRSTMLPTVSFFTSGGWWSVQKKKKTSKGSLNNYIIQKVNDIFNVQFHLEKMDCVEAETYMCTLEPGFPPHTFVLAWFEDSIICTCIHVHRRPIINFFRCQSVTQYIRCSCSFLYFSALSQFIHRVCCTCTCKFGLVYE